MLPLKTFLFTLLLICTFHGYDLYGVSATWKSPSTPPSPLWKDAANWDPVEPIPPGYPDGSDDTATFNRAVPGGVEQTITITDPPISVGTLEFDFFATTYQLTGGTINLFKSVIVSDGTGNISSSLVISDDVTLNVRSLGTMFIDGPLSGSGNITKTGTRILFLTGVAPNTYSGTIFINGGEVSSQFGAGIAGISGNVVINNTGILSFTQENQFGAASEVTCNSGGTLNFNFGDFAFPATEQTMRRFTFNGGSVVPNDNAPHTLNLTAPSGFNLILGSGVTIPDLVSVTLTGASASGVSFNGTTTGASIAAIDLGSVARSFDIANGTTNADLLITGPITQTGVSGITKTGDGTLRLNGSTTLPGSPIVISEGRLDVNSTFSAGTISIPTGGTLGGIGPITVPTVTVSGGTIAPGNSIEQLDIIGDVTFSSGSSLRSEITSTSGNSDLLNVTGIVTVDPSTTLIVDPLPGAYTAGSSYTLLTASGGVSADFDTLVITAAGVQGSSSTDGTSIFFTLTTGGHVGLDFFTTTHNAEQVALCLNEEPLAPGTDEETVAEALQSLESNAKAFENALDQLQPAIFGSLNLIQESQMTLIQSTFSHRLQAWGNCSYGTLTPNTWNLWVKPIGQFISQTSHREQVGYNTRAYGTMIGADRTFLKHLYLGVAAGYIYNDVDWKRSRGAAHSDNVYGGVYAAWQETAFHVLASFVGGWNGYDGDRFIRFSNLRRKAKHDNQGYVLGTHLEGSYAYLKNNTRMQPFASFEYTYSTQDSYNESGARSLNLRVDRKSSDRIRTDIGLDLSHCFKVNCGQLIPNIYASWVWQKEARSGQMKATFKNFNCTMNLHAFRPVRSIFAPGAGLTGVFYGYRLSLALRWDGEFGKRYSNQRALIEATYGF